ncbi:MAG: hypothetical protein M3261_03820 [Thermoproteota archaeon]|nr:hypothetical protein [Thermoproteota archaeon]
MIVETCNDNSLELHVVGSLFGRKVVNEAKNVVASKSIQVKSTSAEEKCITPILYISLDLLNLITYQPQLRRNNRQSR